MKETPPFRVRETASFVVCARLVYTKWPLISTRESNPRPHPYSVRAKRHIIFLRSSRLYEMATYAMTSTWQLLWICRKHMCFCYLGSCRLPWAPCWAVLASLSSLLWFVAMLFCVLNIYTSLICVVHQLIRRSICKY